MSKKVYVVGRAVNDKGWNMGVHYFTLPENAIKFMRSYVARFIMDERAKGHKVSNLIVWRDRVMNDSFEKSQTISFTEDRYFFEFRVWAFNLHSESVSAKDVVNY